MAVPGSDTRCIAIPDQILDLKTAVGPSPASVILAEIVGAHYNSFSFELFPLLMHAHAIEKSNVGDHMCLPFSPFTVFHCDVSAIAITSNHEILWWHDEGGLPSVEEKKPYTGFIGRIISLE